MGRWHTFIDRIERGDVGETDQIDFERAFFSVYDQVVGVYVTMIDAMLIERFEQLEGLLHERGKLGFLEKEALVEEFLEALASKVLVDEVELLALLIDPLQVEKVAVLDGAKGLDLILQVVPLCGILDDLAGIALFRFLMLDDLEISHDVFEGAELFGIVFQTAVDFKLFGPFVRLLLEAKEDKDTAGSVLQLDAGNGLLVLLEDEFADGAGGEDEILVVEGEDVGNEENVGEREDFLGEVVDDEHLIKER